MKPTPPPAVPKPPARTSTPSTPSSPNRGGGGTKGSATSKSNSNPGTANNSYDNSINLDSTAQQGNNSNSNGAVVVSSSNNNNNNTKNGSSFRSRQQLAVASTPKSRLHDTELYEKIKKELPDCAAVDSIKFEHRSRGVNITDEEDGDDGTEGNSNTSSRRRKEPTLDEELARIHRNAQEYEDRMLAGQLGGSDAKNNAERSKEEADAETRVRLQQLEEAMARVDEHFSVVESLEKEYFDAESSRFAKEKAELAERTQKRLEQAKMLVRQADDSAARREKDNKFLDRETAIAELVFSESVERQSLRKDEETKRLSLLKDALESKHYLLGLQDLRTVVKSAWVEGVSKTENWKKWADGLSDEMGLPKVTTATSTAQE